MVFGSDIRCIAITDVPVGSWTVAAVLDLLDARGTDEYQAGADAAVMIGLVAAVPAALSGVTDWSETHGTSQRVGAVHGILNAAAGAVYAGSYAAHKADRRALGRCLGFLGFGLLLAGTYLGGELSYALKIGVNHAPDEKELPEDYTPAVPETDLPEGKPFKAKVNELDILLVKRGPKIYAMTEKCSHAGGPLSEGTLEEDSIVCPWHGSRFCLKDGKVKDGPATTNEPVFDVKVENRQVMVKARSN